MCSGMAKPLEYEHNTKNLASGQTILAKNLLLTGVWKKNVKKKTQASTELILNEVGPVNLFFQS